MSERKTAGQVCAKNRDRIAASLTTLARRLYDPRWLRPAWPVAGTLGNVADLLDEALDAMSIEAVEAMENIR